MNEQENLIKKNPLETQDVGKLILKFAIPAIISILVGAIYNIVDQIFIGQKVGMLGNAATSIAFPITTICTAIALLIGVGSASNFNLEMGGGNKERARYIAGNGISLMVILGVSMGVIVLLFLKPLLLLFGATDQVLSLAITYTGITSIGIPFAIFSTGSSNLIRADGSPSYAMFSVLFGAVLNVILDYIFIFPLNMGMAGAALATIIGQIASGLLIARYLFGFKTIKLTKKHLIPSKKYIIAITSLGAAACFNQLAMALVQIVMNNTLKHYGALSSYGSEIPLACVGVISKVNIVLISFTVGIAQGCQPIFGFNYGAGNYKRVKKAYGIAIVSTTIIGVIAFMCFQLYPRQITALFGQGTNEYFQFAERYFRIFMMLTFINGVQPVTSNFFTSIGKAKKGVLLSLTRQIIFLLPLVLIFPMIFGIDGIIYAGPIADGAAAMLAFYLVFIEMKKM